MNSRISIANLVLAGLVSFIGVGLAYWGWHYGPEKHDAGKAAYMAVKSLTMSDAYDTLRADSLLHLYVARWLGVVVAFWAVITVVIWGAFGRSWFRFRARSKREHIIVVGALPFADALSEKIVSTKREKLTCIQLRGPSDLEFRKGRLIRLPFNGLASGLEEAGIAGARKIILTAGNDAESINLALTLQNRYRNINIVTRLRDIGLARSVNALPGGEKLRVFSEARAAAREVVRRHPPYLIAQDLKHKRIHSVLAGSHDWVEAIMAEVILSACTLTYGNPAFKIFTNNSNDFHLRLLARYPELEKAAEVAFVETDGSNHAPIKDSALADISLVEPVTCAYCAFDDGAHSLVTAVALRDQALQLGEFKAPIFVRMIGEESLPRFVPGSHLPEDALVPFGSMKDITKATGILSRKADKAEQDWHEAYLGMISKGKPAAKPWEELDEEYKIANRRAVAHIYAKLFDAEFDLRPWLAWDTFWDELPGLAHGETLFRNEAERARLAELEHERWNAERRMQGWVYGPKRIDARKIHDCLKPFSELPPEIQAYDFQFIDFLGNSLRHFERGVRRLA